MRKVCAFTGLSDFRQTLNWNICSRRSTESNDSVRVVESSDGKESARNLADEPRKVQGSGVSNDAGAQCTECTFTGVKLTPPCLLVSFEQFRVEFVPVLNNP